MSRKKISNEKKMVPRMEREHPFSFDCYPGVVCFTRCCQDVTIVLTPYDILRLKKSLAINSDEFLDKYTIIIPKEKRLIPLVILKMKEGDKKCPFVTQTGCTVYNDRPWPCRMYPLDMNDDGTFSFITESSRCLGLEEDKIWKISDWLKEQGIEIYEEMNEFLTSLTLQLEAQYLDIDNPKIAKMIFMSLYNLDKFRDFVFKSTFLDRLEVDAKKVEEIKRDDTELLKFAFDWIKFGLFGKKTFWVKQPPPKTP